MIAIAQTLFGITANLGAISTTDEAPWVDLGFAREPKNHVIQRLNDVLRKGGNGRLSKSNPQRDTAHVWFRWDVFVDASARRRGWFILDGPAASPDLPRVQAYVEMARVFTRDEHQRMVDDVVGAIGGGVWETTRALGVAVERRIGVPEVQLLLDDVRREWVAAQSVCRAVVSELAPARPGQRGLPGAPRVARTTDLPENRIVAWWAARRHHQLVQAVRAERSMRSRLAWMLSKAGTAREEHVLKELEEVEGLIAETERWLRLVAAHVVANDEIPEVVGLGVTRDPRRSILLRALRDRVDVASAASDRMSIVRERPTSALFEIWGCIALVHALEKLGWTVITPPKLDSRHLGAISLQRSTWLLQHGAERMSVIYEPHVDQPKVAGEGTGVRRHRLQRALPLPETNELFCVGKVPSPDYALILSTPNGHAFAVGDACASDLNYLISSTKQNELDNLRAKIQKIAYDYGHFIGMRTPVGLLRCSTSASFLLVPGESSRWRLLTAIADAVDHHGIGLIAACPRDARDGDPIARDELGAVVDTLRAHARDHSHWLPVTPGDTRP